MLATRRLLYQLYTKMDCIKVPSIPLTVNLPGYAWSPEKPSTQPILVTASIKTNVSLSGATDNLDHTVSYSDLPKLFNEGIDKNWDLCSLAKHFHTIVDKQCSQTAPSGYTASVKIETPKVLLQAANSGVEQHKEESEIFIERIHISTIIGVRPHERKTEQVVLVDVRAVPLPEWDWRFQPVEQAVIDVCSLLFCIPGRTV